MDKIEAYKELANIKAQYKCSVVSQIKELSTSGGEVPSSVCKFIESFKMSEATKFFENLRKLHNEKNHKLYTNILDEDLNEVGKLKCLSSYMTSACIAMESMKEPDRVLDLRRSIGLEVVSEALADYYNGRNYNSINEALTYLRSLIK